jgi:hypothetical protein
MLHRQDQARVTSYRNGRTTRSGKIGTRLRVGRGSPSRRKEQWLRDHRHHEFAAGGSTNAGSDRSANPQIRGTPGKPEANRRHLLKLADCPRDHFTRDSPPYRVNCLPKARACELVLLWAGDEYGLIAAMIPSSYRRGAVHLS